VFQRELGLFGFDDASEVGDFPVVEGFLAAEIFSKIGCHVTSVTECLTLFFDIFPSRAAFSFCWLSKGGEAS
jgi:hypothetical protein